MPQPELAITPVAAIPVPKMRARAMQMALLSHLFRQIPLFIVKQYTINDFAMSIDIIQKFVMAKGFRTEVRALYKDVDRIYIYTEISNCNISNDGREAVTKTEYNSR